MYLTNLALPSAIYESPLTALGLPIALGLGVGYAVRADTQRTYSSLKKPPGSPPPGVFPIVWTGLYGLMGYASHLILSPSLPAALTGTATSTSGWYTLQLALNVAWMPLFFSLRQPILAAIDIAALLGVNFKLMQDWGAVDATAGYCMAPYVGWLAYATYLCIGTGVLNNWDFGRGRL